MNRITINGNLVGDPQLKFGNSGGRPYTRFRIAESRAEGKDSNFFDVTTFDKLAENVADSLHKGDKVNIDGYFSEARLYQTEAGEWRVSLDIIANEVSPSLRFATTSITRNPRSETVSTTAPTVYQYEEEPF